MSFYPNLMGQLYGPKTERVPCARLVVTKSFRSPPIKGEGVSHIMANKELGIRDANQLCDIAVSICGSFCDGRPTRANSMTLIISSILELIEDLEPVEKAEITKRLETTIVRLIDAAMPCMVLGDEYYFDRVRVQLDLVTSVIAATEMVVGNDALSLDQKKVLIDAVEPLLNPALRLVVRLANPDGHEFEWVDDYSVRLASEAMTIAWRISAIVEDRGREVRRVCTR